MISITPQSGGIQREIIQNKTQEPARKARGPIPQKSGGRYGFQLPGSTFHRLCLWTVIPNTSRLRATAERILERQCRKNHVRNPKECQSHRVSNARTQAYKKDIFIR